MRTSNSVIHLSTNMHKDDVSLAHREKDQFSGITVCLLFRQIEGHGES